MAATTGDAGAGGSPLSGCYLLLVLSEPHRADHRPLILQRVIKGLSSWDRRQCGVDLGLELQALIDSNPEGEQFKFGERLIQFATENIVAEILVNPQVYTFQQCLKNMLSSFTRHRHLIHAGYSFSGNGSWILQDGTFSGSDLLDALRETDVQRVTRAYESSLSVHIHCPEEGIWRSDTLLKDPVFTASKVVMNPPDGADPAPAQIEAFREYLSGFLTPASLEDLLNPSDVVGNIRFSRPTLYVFPGGQGDAAMFGINGFNILFDGGFSRRACCWNFVRHLDRLDAVLMSRLNNGNLMGMSAMLQRKEDNATYPQMGHFFANLVDQKSSADVDKDADPLLVNTQLEAQRLLENLKALSLKPTPCLRENSTDPINLYHKVGHGRLDLFVLNPQKDGNEMQTFLRSWADGPEQSRVTLRVKGREFPVANLVSICCLLVWIPDDRHDTVTRLLFPGSTPQQKVFEGLDRLKHLDFMKTPVCYVKSLGVKKHKTLDTLLKSGTKAPPISSRTERIERVEVEQKRRVRSTSRQTRNGDATDASKKTEKAEKELLAEIKAKKQEANRERAERAPVAKPKPAKQEKPDQQPKEPRPVSVSRPKKVPKASKDDNKQTDESSEGKNGSMTSLPKEEKEHTPVKVKKDVNNKMIVEEKKVSRTTAKAKQTKTETKAKTVESKVVSKVTETKTAKTVDTKKVTEKVKSRPEPKAEKPTGARTRVKPPASPKHVRSVKPKPVQGGKPTATSTPKAKSSQEQEVSTMKGSGDIEEVTMAGDMLTVTKVTTEVQRFIEEVHEGDSLEQMSGDFSREIETDSLELRKVDEKVDSLKQSPTTEESKDLRQSSEEVLRRTDIEEAVLLRETSEQKSPPRPSEEQMKLGDLERMSSQKKDAVKTPDEVAELPEHEALELSEHEVQHLRTGVPVRSTDDIQRVMTTSHEPPTEEDTEKEKESVAEEKFSPPKGEKDEMNRRTKDNSPEEPGDEELPSAEAGADTRESLTQSPSYVEGGEPSPKNSGHIEDSYTSPRREMYPIGEPYVESGVEAETKHETVQRERAEMVMLASSTTTPSPSSPSRDRWATEAPHLPSVDERSLEEALPRDVSTASGTTELSTVKIEDLYGDADKAPVDLQTEITEGDKKTSEVEQSPKYDLKSFGKTDIEISHKIADQPSIEKDEEIEQEAHVEAPKDITEKSYLSEERRSPSDSPYQASRDDGDDKINAFLSEQALLVEERVDSSEHVVVAHQTTDSTLIHEAHPDSEEIEKMKPTVEPDSDKGKTPEATSVELPKQPDKAGTDKPGDDKKVEQTPVTVSQEPLVSDAPHIEEKAPIDEDVVALESDRERVQEESLKPAMTSEKPSSQEHKEDDKAQDGEQQIAAFLQEQASLVQTQSQLPQTTKVEDEEVTMASDIARDSYDIMTQGDKRAERSPDASPSKDDTQNPQKSPKLGIDKDVDESRKPSHKEDEVRDDETSHSKVYEEYSWIEKEQPDKKGFSASDPHVLTTDDTEIVSVSKSHQSDEERISAFMAEQASLVLEHDVSQKDVPTSGVPERSPTAGVSDTQLDASSHVIGDDDETSLEVSKPQEKLPDIPKVPSPKDTEKDSFSKLAGDIKPDVHTEKTGSTLTFEITKTTMKVDDIEKSHDIDTTVTHPDKPIQPKDEIKEVKAYDEDEKYTTLDTKTTMSTREESQSVYSQEQEQEQEVASPSQLTSFVYEPVTSDVSKHVETVDEKRVLDESKQAEKLQSEEAHDEGKVSDDKVSVEKEHKQQRSISPEYVGQLGGKTRVVSEKSVTEQYFTEASHVTKVSDTIEATTYTSLTSTMSRDFGGVKTAADEVHFDAAKDKQRVSEFLTEQAGLVKYEPVEDLSKVDGSPIADAFDRTPSPEAIISDSKQPTSQEYSGADKMSVDVKETLKSQLPKQTTDDIHHTPEAKPEPEPKDHRVTPETDIALQAPVTSPPKDKDVEKKESADELTLTNIPGIAAAAKEDKQVPSNAEEILDTKIVTGAAPEPVHQEKDFSSKPSAPDDGAHFDDKSRTDTSVPQQIETITESKVEVQTKHLSDVHTSETVDRTEDKDHIDAFLKEQSELVRDDEAVRMEKPKDISEHDAPVTKMLEPVEKEFDWAKQPDIVPAVRETESVKAMEEPKHSELMRKEDTILMHQTESTTLGDTEKRKESETPEVSTTLHEPEWKITSEQVVEEVIISPLQKPHEDKSSESPEDAFMREQAALVREETGDKGSRLDETVTLTSKAHLEKSSDIEAKIMTETYHEVAAKVTDQKFEKHEEVVEAHVRLAETTDIPAVSKPESPGDVLSTGHGEERKEKAADHDIPASKDIVPESEVAADDKIAEHPGDERLQKPEQAPESKDPIRSESPESAFLAEQFDIVKGKAAIQESLEIKEEKKISADTSPVKRETEGKIEPTKPTEDVTSKDLHEAVTEHLGATATTATTTVDQTIHESEKRVISGILTSEGPEHLQPEKQKDQGKFLKDEPDVTEQVPKDMGPKRTQPDMDTPSDKMLHTEKFMETMHKPEQVPVVTDSTRPESPETFFLKEQAALVQGKAPAQEDVIVAETKPSSESAITTRPDSPETAFIKEQAELVKTEYPLSQDVTAQEPKTHTAISSEKVTTTHEQKYDETVEAKQITDTTKTDDQKSLEKMIDKEQTDETKDEIRFQWDVSFKETKVESVTIEAVSSSEAGKAAEKIDVTSHIPTGRPDSPEQLFLKEQAELVTETAPLDEKVTEKAKTPTKDIETRGTPMTAAQTKEAVAPSEKVESSQSETSSFTHAAAAAPSPSLQMTSTVVESETSEHQPPSLTESTTSEVSVTSSQSRKTSYIIEEYEVISPRRRQQYEDVEEIVTYSPKSQRSRKVSEVSVISSTEEHVPRPTDQQASVEKLSKETASVMQKTSGITVEESKSKPITVSVTSKTVEMSHSGKTSDDEGEDTEERIVAVKASHGSFAVPPRQAIDVTGSADSSLGPYLDEEDLVSQIRTTHAQAEKPVTQDIGAVEEQIVSAQTTFGSFAEPPPRYEKSPSQPAHAAHRDVDEDDLMSQILSGKDIATEIISSTKPADTSVSSKVAAKSMAEQTTKASPQKDNSDEDDIVEEKVCSFNDPRVCGKDDASLPHKVAVDPKLDHCNHSPSSAQAEIEDTLLQTGASLIAKSASYETLAAAAGKLDDKPVETKVSHKPVERDLDSLLSQIQTYEESMPMSSGGPTKLPSPLTEAPPVPIHPKPSKPTEDLTSKLEDFGSDFDKMMKAKPSKIKDEDICIGEDDGGDYAMDAEGPVTCRKMADLGPIATKDDTATKEFEPSGKDKTSDVEESSPDKSGTTISEKTGNDATKTSPLEESTEKIAEDVTHAQTTTGEKSPTDAPEKDDSWLDEQISDVTEKTQPTSKHIAAYSSKTIKSPRRKVVESPDLSDDDLLTDEAKAKSQTSADSKASSPEEKPTTAGRDMAVDVEKAPSHSDHDKTATPSPKDTALPEPQPIVLVKDEAKEVDQTGSAREEPVSPAAAGMGWVKSDTSADTVATSEFDYPTLQQSEGGSAPEVTTSQDKDSKEPKAPADVDRTETDDIDARVFKPSEVTSQFLKTEDSMNGNASGDTEGAVVHELLDAGGILSAFVPGAAERFEGLHHDEHTTAPSGGTDPGPAKHADAAPSSAVSGVAPAEPSFSPTAPPVERRDPGEGPGVAPDPTEGKVDVVDGAGGRSMGWVSEKDSETKTEQDVKVEGEMKQEASQVGTTSADIEKPDTEIATAGVIQITETAAVAQDVGGGRQTKPIDGESKEIQMEGLIISETTEKTKTAEQTKDKGPDTGMSKERKADESTIEHIGHLAHDAILAAESEAEKVVSSISTTFSSLAESASTGLGITTHSRDVEETSDKTSDKAATSPAKDAEKSTEESTATHVGHVVHDVLVAAEHKAEEAAAAVSTTISSLGESAAAGLGLTSHEEVIEKPSTVTSLGVDDTSVPKEQATSVPKEAVKTTEESNVSHLGHLAHDAFVAAETEVEKAASAITSTLSSLAESSGMTSHRDSTSPHQEVHSKDDVTEQPKETMKKTTEESTLEHLEHVVHDTIVSAESEVEKVASSITGTLSSFAERAGVELGLVSDAGQPSASVTATPSDNLTKPAEVSGIKPVHESASVPEMPSEKIPASEGHPAASRSQSTPAVKYPVEPHPELARQTSDILSTSAKEHVKDDTAHAVTSVSQYIAEASAKIEDFMAGRSKPESADDLLDEPTMSQEQLRESIKDAQKATSDVADVVEEVASSVSAFTTGGLTTPPVTPTDKEPSVEGQQSSTEAKSLDTKSSPVKDDDHEETGGLAAFTSTIGSVLQSAGQILSGTVPSAAEHLEKQIISVDSADKSDSPSALAEKAADLHDAQSSIQQTIGETEKSVEKTIEDTEKDGKEKVEDTREAVGKSTDELQKRLGESIQETSKALKDDAANAMKAAEEVVGRVTSAAQEKAAETESSFAAVKDALATTVQDVKDATKSGVSVETGKQIICDVAASVEEKGASAVAGAGKVIEAISDATASVTSTGKDVIAESAAELAQQVQTKTGTVAEKAEEEAEKTSSSLFGFIAGGIQGVKESAESAAKEIQDDLTRSSKETGEKAESVAQAVAEIIRDVHDTTASSAQAAKEDVSDVFKSASDCTHSAGKVVDESLSSGKAQTKALLDYVTGAAEQAVTSADHELATAVADITKTVDRTVSGAAEVQIESANDQFKETESALSSATKDVLSHAETASKSSVDAVSDAAEKLAEQATSVRKATEESLASQLKEARDQFHETSSLLEQTATSAAQDGREAAADLQKSTSDFVTAGGQDIKSQAESLIKETQDAKDRTNDFAKDKVEELIKDAEDTKQQVASSLSTLTDASKTSLESASDHIKSTAEQAAKDVAADTQQIKESAVSLSQDIKDKVSTAAEEVSDKADAFVKSSGDALSSTVESAVGKTKQAKQEGDKALATMAEQAQGHVDTVTTDVERKMTAGADSIRDLSETAVKAAGDAFTTGVEEVQTHGKDAVQDAKAFKTDVEKSAAGVVEDISEKGEKAKAQVEEAATTAADTLTSTMKSAASQIKAVAQETDKAISSEVQDVKTGMQTVAQEVVDVVKVGASEAEKEVARIDQAFATQVKGVEKEMKSTGEAIDKAYSQTMAEAEKEAKEAASYALEAGQQAAKQAQETTSKIQTEAKETLATADQQLSSVVKEAEQTVNLGIEKLGQLSREADSQLSQAAQGATKTADDTVRAAEETLTQLGREASSTVKGAEDVAKEAAGSVASGVGSLVQGVSSGLSEAERELQASAEQAAAETSEMAESMYQSAEETLEEASSSVRSTFGGLFGFGRRKSKDTKEVVKETKEPEPKEVKESPKAEKKSGGGFFSKMFGRKSPEEAAKPPSEEPKPVVSERPVSPPVQRREVVEEFIERRDIHHTGDDDRRPSSELSDIREEMSGSSSTREPSSPRVPPSHDAPQAGAEGGDPLRRPRAALDPMTSSMHESFHDVMTGSFHEALQDGEESLGLPGVEFRQPRSPPQSLSPSVNQQDGEPDQPVPGWGPPLGLPTPVPPPDHGGIQTPPPTKRAIMSRARASDSPRGGGRISGPPPVYLDLVYVPHHANSFYSGVQFFHRVRARYYVFSSIEPSREVFNALLEAKQQWEDKDLEVTIIPTYDTDTLGHWFASNEQQLEDLKIDLAPSASRCTINLQDHETSCAAYRLEF